MMANHLNRNDILSTWWR